MSNLVNIALLFPTIQGAFLAQPKLPPQDIRIVTVTAYSSTLDQTDSTPFITASNKLVEEGIVAANFLPFGTRICFPELDNCYQEYIVEDRMNSRFVGDGIKRIGRVDIWVKTRTKAKEFGAILEIKMLVIEKPEPEGQTVN